MKLKNLGWHSFFALLLTDVVGVVMLELGIGLKTTLTVTALVFVILLVVLAFGLHTKLRSHQREAQQEARIAELEDKVNERSKRKDEPAK